MDESVSAVNGLTHLATQLGISRTHEIWAQKSKDFSHSQTEKHAGVGKEEDKGQGALRKENKHFDSIGINQ